METAGLIRFKQIVSRFKAESAQKSSSIYRIYGDIHFKDQNFSRKANPGGLEGNRSDTAHAPFRKGETTLAQYKFIHFGFKTNARLLGWIPP